MTTTESGSTKQITSCLGTIHYAYSFTEEDLETPVYNRVVNDRLYNNVRHWLETHVGEEGWWSMCHEVGDLNSKEHIHFAFQLKPKGKISLGKVQNAWRKQFGVACDTRFPLRCLDESQPKCIKWYLEKGEQSHAEWDELGNQGSTFGKNAVFDTGGTLRNPKETQGKRKDITELAIIIQEGNFALGIQRPNNMKQLMTAEVYRPYMHTLAQHYKFCLQQFQMRKPLQRAIIQQMRPWQQQLWRLLTEQEPDDRTITWIYDPKGGAGKSTFVKHLLVNQDAVTLSGKQADMLYGYSGQSIIVCDMPRSDNQEYLNYGAIEKLKDGVFFSTKYESSMYVRDYNAHVVCFSNHIPDQTKWTSDRYSIWRLSELEGEQTTFAPGQEQNWQQFSQPEESQAVSP